MHGAAPKSNTPAKLAEVSLAAGLKDKNVESFFRGLAAALKTGDAKPLLRRLADGYTIEGLPPEWEIRESFVKAIGMIAGPDEIAVTAIKRDGDTKTVTTEFRFATRVATKTFKFDAHDKLLNTDFISMKRAPAPAASPTAKSETKK
jgi:phosphopantetheinyl transferase